MFKTEIYRILSRRVALAAMTIALAIAVYYGFVSVWDEGLVKEGTVGPGEVYRRKEAIERDKELTAEFAGPLTEETVQAIWEKYGPPVNYANRSTTEAHLNAVAAGGGNDNYCNRFVARLFGEEVVGEDGSVTYVLGENLSESRYLQGNYTFGYVGEGWTYFGSDQFLLAFEMVCVVIIVALSSVFSEDYACRTADIILPTAKGRFGLWRVRTAAGCCFASLYYWLICSVIFVHQLLLYGTEGLKVSSGLTSMPVYWQYDEMPVGKAILMLYLAGWFAVLVLTLLVYGISAVCRHTFSALVWSLAAYLGPYFFMRIVLDTLPVNRLNVILHRICYGMPFTYAEIFMDSPLEMRLWLTEVALTVMGIGIALGVQGYCKHQVKN